MRKHNTAQQSFPLLAFLFVLSSCGLSLKKNPSSPLVFDPGYESVTPSVQFGTGIATNLPESQNSVILPVTLSSLATQAISIPYTVSGTAGASDHNLVSGSISLPVGSQGTSITFNLLNDPLDEDQEDLVITLGSPTNATLGSNTSVTLQIVDDDLPPLIRFTQSTQAFQENAAPASLTVSLSAPSGKPVGASVSASGTATEGADYSISATTLSFLPGETTKNITFTPLADGLSEGPETAIFTLSSPSNSSVGSPNALTITLQDVALTMRTAQFSAPTQSSSEGGGAVTLTLNLSGAAAAPITVPFSLTGTASQGADYSMSSTGFSFATGTSSASVTLTPVNDTSDEPDETIILTLGTPTGPATLGMPSSTTVTLADNDNPPVLTWQTAAQSFAENGGSAIVVANLGSASSFPVSATYTFGGTAVRGTDYTAPAATGTLNIPAGSLTGSVAIPIIDNTTLQAARTVSLSLSAPVNATLGASTVHTLSITDNDTLPLLQFSSAAVTVPESAGSGSVTVTLSQALPQNTTVAYTVSGTASNPADHNLVSGSVVIPANATTASIPYTIVNDTAIEPSETIVLTLGSAAGTSPGTNPVMTITIADNDSPNPSISLATSSSTVSEGAGTANITVNLSQPASSLLYVGYSVSGSALLDVDYSASLNLSSSTILTITPGASSGTISIPITDDVLRENPETIVVTLQNSSMGSYTISGGNAHTISITDNDPIPSVSWASSSMSVSESVGTVTLNAVLSAPSSIPVSVPFTVSGTSTNPSDHGAASGTLTFGPGQTNLSYNFFIGQDSISESNETVILTLGTPVNASLGSTPTHTLTISDAAPAAIRLGWTVVNQSASEGNSITLKASLNAAATAAISAPVSISGTATSGADFTLSSTSISIPAGSTQGSVTLSLLNDSVSEVAESVILTLGTPSGAGLERGLYTSTITLTDATPLPVVTFDTTGYVFDSFRGAFERSIMENAGSLTLTAKLSGPASQVVRVPYFVRDNAGGDYGIGPGEFLFPAGSTTATKTIPILDNSSLSTGFNRLFFMLAQPLNAAIGLPELLLVNMLDDEIPIASFNPSTLSVSEGSSNTAIQVTLSRPLPGTSPVTLSVGVDSTASNASSGSDFQLGSTSITFNPGATQGSVSLNLPDDTVAEPTEFLFLTLSGSDSVTTNNARIAISIRDNDGAGNLAWGNVPGYTSSSTSTLSASVPESVTSLQLPVVLSSPQAAAVTIPVTIESQTNAVTGTDFLLSTPSVTIPAGSTSGLLTVNLVDDSTFRGGRLLRLRLGTVPGITTVGAPSLSLTILENDPLPTVQFTSAEQTHPESAGSISVPAQLGSLSAIALSSTIQAGILNDSPFGSLKPNEYTLSNSTVNFPAGSLNGAVSLGIINDMLSEDPEFLGLSFSSSTSFGNFGISTPTPAGLTLSRLNVTDDDPSPTVSWGSASQSVAESVGRASVTATLSAAAGKTIRVLYNVGGSSSFGSDHQAGSTELVIPEGSTSETLDITILPDSISEGNETLTLTLSPSAGNNANIGAMATHTITITDAAAATWTLAAFQATVYPLVTQQCAGCHSSGINFADPNVNNAFATAKTKANWDNIPQSIFAIKLAENHQSKGAYYNEMITQITAWKQQSGGSGGGGTSTLSSGTIGILDFVQFENALDRATEGHILSLSNGANNTRLSLSANGDPLDVSPPMIGGYIAMAAEYCKLMVTEIASGNANSRGFNQITGLNNFGVSASSFSQTMQDQVTQRFATMFWQRNATATELNEVRVLVNDLKSANAGINTRDLGIGMCTAIAGAADSIDTN